MQPKSKRNLIVGGSVLAATCLGVGGAVIAHTLVGAVIGVVATIVITIVADPLVDAWKGLIREIYEDGLHRPARVFAFGPQGAGKSTLRERLLSPVTPDAAKVSTELFDTRDAPIVINVTSKSSLKVIIADYSGQDTDQVLLDKHEDFFGSITKRQVDVVYFLTDLIPAYRDTVSNTPIPDDRVIEQYAAGAEAIIAARVEETYRYLSLPQLTTILKLCGAREKSVKAVRLLVSKVDLVQKVVDRRYLNLPNGLNSEQYALAQYARLNRELAAICNDFRIKDYAFLSVNLLTGDGVSPDWGVILKRLHESRSGEREVKP